jgi:nucleoside-diphosphate-sugar epimerase
VDVHGDGQQVRDFLFVSDVVGSVLAALAIEDNAIWNVASSEATSIIDLGTAMAAAGRRVAGRDRLWVAIGTVLQRMVWYPQ